MQAQSAITVNPHQGEPMTSGGQHKVRIWDLPTRVFHWALLVCVVGLVITGNVGGNWMQWHFRLGYCVMSLLLFRLVWGLVGGRWSRFVSFIYSPGSVIAYLKGQGKPEHSAGHSPIGALSVFALLAFLMAQVATGLFADDAIMNQGPLTRFASGLWVDRATFWHKEVGKTVLIVLIVMHIAAVLFYLYKKKQNLIRPMIHGDKELPAQIPASRDTAGSRLAALVIFLLCAAVVYWVQSLGAAAY
jgi:cytochrome b